MMEEIQNVTWGLWGQELSHEQAIQRIVAAGFPIKDGVALNMFAIVEGESGEYQRAWHANVARDEDGLIVRNVDGTMTVKSIDLGFMQFNVEVSPDRRVGMNEEEAGDFVDSMFAANPDLENPWLSAVRAYELWRVRGFQPWFAYKPGTEAFMLKKRYGALAFSNWLVHSFVDKRLRVVYK